MNPDWVITGESTPEGVRLRASKTTLPGGSIEIIEREDVVHDGAGHTAPTLRHDHYRVTVLTEDMFTVEGRDYAEALRILFQIWQPGAQAATPVTGVFTREIGS